MDEGRWTMDEGRWTREDGRWTREERRWTMDEVGRTEAQEDGRKEDPKNPICERSESLSQGFR